jgi:hypothetical protein
MRRPSNALRWIIAAALVVAGVAFANVALLGATEEDDPVGRLRPLLVEPAPATRAETTPQDRPATTVEPPASTSTTTGDDSEDRDSSGSGDGRGDDREPDDDRSGRKDGEADDD